MKSLKIAIALLFTVSALCSCGNSNNGAHEYSKTENQDSRKMNDSPLISEMIGKGYGFNTLPSCCNYRDSVYTYYIDEKVENNIFLSQDNNEFKRLAIDYSNINKYVPADDKIYLHCYDPDGNPCIVKTDITGKTEKTVESDYCEDLFVNDEKIFLVSLDVKDQYIVTEYDHQLNKIQKYNLSEIVCPDNDILIWIKYYNNCFYLLKAVGVKSRDTENENFDLKIAVYNITSSTVEQEIDLSNIMGADNFAGYYVSDE